MVEFKESKFYKLLQDFFINNDKETFIQFLAEFYNRTEGIIDKNGTQDDLIKELRELYLEFNEKGIDENIVREKVNYFLENSVKIKDILAKLVINTNKIEDVNTKLNAKLDTKANESDLIVERQRIDSFTKLANGSTTGDAELIDGRIGADGLTYDNIGGAIRTQISNINDKINKSTSVIEYKNILSYGDMKEITHFSGSNLSQETKGIRATSTSATTLLYTNVPFKIKADTSYVLILSLVSDSNVTITTALYNDGVYYSTNNVDLVSGKNYQCFTINRTNNTEANVSLFINSLGASNILFKNILLIPLVNNTSISEIDSYYNKTGFFINGYDKNFYDKKDVYNKEEVNALVGKINDGFKTVNLTAYSDSTTAGDIVESETVFIGYVNNKNAIERAIDTVRNKRNQKTIITCIGNFIGESFDKMLDNDSYGRGYRSFISFNNTFNVTLKGVGNKETKIEITLPDESGINYGNYQIVNFDGINPTIENMKIIGRNMRYALHSDTTGDTNHNEGSNFLIKDCDIKHIVQGTNASASWASAAGIGLGLSDKTTFTIENCVIQGVQADIVGHDSARATEYKFTAKGCIFSMATGTAFNWRLVSTSSKCNAIYEFVGNSFGDKNINIGNSIDSVDFYAIVKGYGNSIRFINNYNYLFSDEYEVKKAYNNNIIKNSIVDTYGNYSNGLLYGLALDDVAYGQEVRVLTKGLVKITDIRVKEGEIFNAGDYVTAENGAIKKSTIPTRWTIFELWGQKYLRIE